VDQTLADLAGELARRYVKSHPSVDTVDYIVAALVEALDAESATTKLKHFPMFTGLKKPY
jgi:predicted nucleic acid-binding protein